MKVLITTGVYPPEIGGPATYTWLLERELPKHDVVVDVLPFRDVRHLPKGLRHVAFAWKTFVRALHADVVIAQDTLSTALPVMIGAMLAMKPLVLRVPGDYAWEQARQRFGVEDMLDTFQTKRYGRMVELLRRLQSWTVRRASVVIAPSAYMADIVRTWDVDPDSIRVLHNGIELPINVIEPRARPEGKLIVSVGRLVPWKEFKGVIDAVSANRAWQLVIVGDGPDREELEEYAEGRSENMHFVGALPREEMLGWVETADVFVLNSTFENHPHTLVEAMSLGTPVIATDICGNPEVVTHEEDGLLIPVRDSLTLARSIEYTFEDMEATNERVRKAQVRAEEYDIQNTITPLVTILKQVCAS